QQRAAVAVAEHLDVAAQRDGAEFPARPGAIPPAEQLRAEADRKDLDPYPVPPRDPVMTKLVHEDQHGQDDEKRDDVIEPVVQETDHFKSIGSPSGALARIRG